MTDFKAMGLYRNVDRVLADLNAVGIGPDDPLTVGDLTPFDQYHYEGTSAVDDACAFLGADATTHLLDIGSGLGGPARYIAAQSGSQVTALEIQSDLNETAAALTTRCGLSPQVTHLGGDILAGDAPADTFDGIVSMLCFLHIPDRARLFEQCARSLAPGGAIFIDDYYAIDELTDDERHALAEKVYCPYVPSLDTYVADLKGAGFVDIATTDKTADWTAFVAERLGAFRAQQANLVERYDPDTVASLDEFYSTVASVFADGRLGGVRLTARQPAS